MEWSVRERRRLTRRQDGVGLGSAIELVAGAAGAVRNGDWRCNLMILRVPGPLEGVTVKLAGRLIISRQTLLL
jgi:hypothetical protein